MDVPTYERELEKEGFHAVCGVDEVGRGPFAGPVVCAAVIMPLGESLRVKGVDDSKQLSAKKREQLAEEIEKTALAYAVAEANAETIDRINILQATRLCMKQAIGTMGLNADMVLVDGVMKLDLDIPQRSIVKGDARVYSIGAASILAKVYRDRLMREYDEIWPEYGFSRNVGYGTKEHIAAIREVGICKIHRRTFVKNYWDGRVRP